MSDLTDKFVALEGELSDNQAAIMGALADLQTAIDGINTNLAILQENGAVNTKALLAALGQTGACFPCPTPSVVVPPIGTTPSTATQNHCKRAQAFVAAVGSILTAFDTMQSFNVIGTYNVVSDAISEVIGAITAGDTIPLPSFPEAVQIVGTYISYAGERIFTGTPIMDQYTPLHDDLVAALFATTTPGDAKSAFEGVVNSSGATDQAKFLIIATAYTALYTYYFDPSTLPDLSAYDGTACGETTADCVSLTRIPFTSANFGSFYGFEWPDGFTVISHTTVNDDELTPAINAVMDFTGCTLHVDAGEVRIVGQSGSSVHGVGYTYEATGLETELWIVETDPTAAVTLCCPVLPPPGRS